MKLIEIGPFFAPLAPKIDGYATCIVDRESYENLLKSYAYIGDDLKKIEKVDIVWEQGSLHDMFPIEQHGTFDAIIASHVVEHMYNMVSFFESVSKLLKPAGQLLLILPDKRFCFDYFRPVTMTEDVYDSHRAKLDNFERRSAFNHIAYSVKNDGQISWNLGSVRGLEFISNVAAAASHADADAGADGRKDNDFHVWCFVPSSFELVALELFHIALTDLFVETVSQTTNGEFFACLTAGVGKPLTPDVLAKRRMELLLKTQEELSLQLRLARFGGLSGKWYYGLLPDSLIASFEIGRHRFVNFYRRCCKRLSRST